MSLLHKNFGFAAFRQRFIFRGVFILLILATLLLALVLLKEEKERSYQNYQQNFQKTYAELMARLRHPTGRLMLLNPQHNNHNKAPLSPLILPYGAIDFTDRNKAWQAVEMSGCSVQYGNNSSLCVAMGNNPFAGGFIYLVGSFPTQQLIERPVKQRELDDVHRFIITLDLPNEHSRWVAPFEKHVSANPNAVWGRLPGFNTELDRLTQNSRENKEFRGWLWLDQQCLEANQTPLDCNKLAFYAIRVPVDTFSRNIHNLGGPTWPPIPLNEVKVRLQILAPYNQAAVFDSNDASAVLPPTLDDLSRILMAGEELIIQKVSAPKQTAIKLKLPEQPIAIPSWFSDLIDLLPAKNYQQMLSLTDTISTPLGNYQITLVGDIHSVERSLALVASRVSWYVLGMVIAILLAWIIIELGLIRPIVRLAKKAAQVANDLQQGDLETNLAQLDFSKLKGKDELGIMGTALSGLLQRVKDDLQREHIRAQQERDMWHAVGHEIMSPLQSLMVLHKDKEDASHRYVQRMQQAIQVIYGTASPSEAFTAATLQLDLLNLNEFLQTLADNAPFVDIDNVIFQPPTDIITVRADEFSLEDVITHILRNADRYRLADTPITIHIETTSSTAQVYIHNSGASIDPAIINNIFEYGVSDPDTQATNPHRGQGLFVAKTYMAKMGGTIQVKNENEGVTFILTLQRQ